MAFSTAATSFSVSPRFLSGYLSMKAEDDLVRSAFAAAVANALVGFGRVNLAVWYAMRRERGAFRSQTARTILAGRGVEIGVWSYGACFLLGAFDPRSVIGNYVSIGPGVVRRGRNHPLDCASLHPLFFNSKLGVVSKDEVEFSPFCIESDGWVGQNAIITPAVRRIGLGAVVAAGSVVTRNVPDFAVVGGNPAKLIKYRFDSCIQQEIRDSAWWTESYSRLAQRVDWFRDISRHDARVEMG